MPTHYHLLVQTPGANLSRCMRHIDGVYTQRFNRARETDGSLFRGRYKSIVVGGDSYLLQLVRYIHRNPLRAGLSDSLEKYPWTSHRAYLSDAESWNWIHKEPLLTMLSPNGRGRITAYRRFVGLEDPDTIIDLLERKKWPAILAPSVSSTRQGRNSSPETSTKRSHSQGNWRPLWIPSELQCVHRTGLAKAIGALPERNLERSAECGYLSHQTTERRDAFAHWGVLPDEQV